MRIQAYLTAAVITLKRLAAALVTLSLAVLLATRPMLARAGAPTDLITPTAGRISQQTPHEVLTLSAPRRVVGVRR